MAKKNGPTCTPTCLRKKNCFFFLFCFVFVFNFCPLSYDMLFFPLLGKKTCRLPSAETNSLSKMTCHSSRLLHLDVATRPDSDPPVRPDWNDRFWLSFSSILEGFLSSSQTQMTHGINLTQNGPKKMFKKYKNIFGKKQLKNSVLQLIYALKIVQKTHIKYV